MYITTLKPYPTQQKSFYGKACLVQEGKTTFLRSYSTFVAEYNNETQELKVHGFYSNTTTRHIKAFIYFITGEFLSTKEIENKYYHKGDN